MPLLDPNAPSPPSPFLDEKAPSGTETILVGPGGPSSPPTDVPSASPENLANGHIQQGINEIGRGIATMNTDFFEGLQEAGSGALGVIGGVAERIFGSE